MGCIYKYKNLVFNNELKLDEYLLSMESLIKEYGDLVFSYSTLQAKNRERLEKGHNGWKETAKRIKDNYYKDKLVMENGDLDNVELADGLHRDYISMTDLIHGLRSSTGDLIFPIFNPDEYWKHMDKVLKNLVDYINPDGTLKAPADPDDHTHHFLTLYDVPLLCEKVGSRYDVHNYTNAEVLAYRKKMEDYVWPQQGKAGTAIHDIMSYCFLNYFDNNYLLHTNVIADAIKSNPGFYDKIKEFISDETLESTIDNFIALKLKIKTKYNNPIVLTEIPLTGDIVTPSGLHASVVSRLDLLVMDENGDIDIYDFKCSPRDFVNYNDAKVRTFEYQLAAYRRIIESLGLTYPGRPSLKIVPLQMKNFKFEDDKITFGKIKMEANPIVDLDEIIRRDNKYDNVENNLDNVFKYNSIENCDGLEILSSTEEFVKKSFSTYYNNLNKTAEDVKKIIEKNGGIQEESSKKVVYFKNGKVVKADTEDQLIQEILNDYKKAKNRRYDEALSLTKALEEALKNNIGDAFYYDTGKHVGFKSGKLDWFNKLMRKYATNKWEVVTKYKSSSDAENNAVSALNHLGIILVRNKITGVVDVIKLSSDYNLDYPVTLGPASNNNTNILGTYMSDTLAFNDPSSLVLESNNGNVELMEAMAALNCLSNSYFKGDNHILGEIKVISTLNNEGITASNKLLLYNFRKLCDLGKFQNNYCYDSDNLDKIKLLTYAELAKLSFLELLNDTSATKSSNVLTRLLTVQELFLGFDELYGNKEAFSFKLNEIRTKLEKEYSILGGSDIRNLDITDTSHPEFKIYSLVLDAINEVNGIDLRQQIKDHGKWLEGTVVNALTSGVNGSYIDNPGTLKSSTLNLFSALTEKAYLQVRVKMTNFNEEIQKAILELKEEKSFGWGSKVTVGNLAKLYENLYVKNPDGSINNKFMFKDINDSTLLAAEKKLLNLAIRKFAEDRYKDEVCVNGIFNEELFLEKYYSNPEEMRQVPLVMGNLESRIALTGGLMAAAESKIKGMFFDSSTGKFTWDKLKEKTLTDIRGLVTEELEKAINRNEDMFNMINRIKNGYDPTIRDQMLNPNNPAAKYDVSDFEINVEKLLLSHKMAYTLQSEVNKIFPMMKGILLHLSNLGLIMNTEFTDDVLFGLDYIKSKIFNLPLDDMNKWSGLNLVSRELMSGMSKVALAFNPKSLYQVMDGLWKDAMLVLQLPDMTVDGKTAFTKQNMTDSFKWIMQDLTHSGDEPTIGEALNRLYGINDMDINTYQNRLHNDNAGIYNFWSLGFRFASRPDYYNRMTIFGALMRSDGSFEAHTLKDGVLTYDWTKDKRFDLYANIRDTSTLTPEQLAKYNKLKSLYKTMAEDFVKEGATYKDGSKFSLDLDHPEPLPRAYTTLQSESMKALGDKIYGYYAHEKRSMMLSYSLGALFWQMNTFWSSKKNQYLSGRGFTLLGEYRHYTEIITDELGNSVEVKYYYREIDGKLEPVADIPENNLTDIERQSPVMVWKGRPLEGIILTLSHIARDLVFGQTDENDVTRKGWKFMMEDMFGEHVDPDLKHLYRANLTQFLYDLFMFLFMGCLVAPWLVRQTKDHIKEVGNSNFADAALNNTLLLGANMFKTSTDDFFFIESIGGRAQLWTPFSIEAASSLVDNFVGIVDGTRDGFDALVNATAFGRLNKPMFDFLKLSMFDVPLGTNMNKQDK